MDLGLQKASDFGKRRYPSGEFDIAYVFYGLEWTWSEMLWLVSSHRIVEAKRASSVGADIEGDGNLKLEAILCSTGKSTARSLSHIKSDNGRKWPSSARGCRGSFFSLSIPFLGALSDTH
jgi:hypothetical protein